MLSVILYSLLHKDIKKGGILEYTRSFSDISILPGGGVLYFQFSVVDMKKYISVTCNSFFLRLKSLFKGKY